MLYCIDSDCNDTGRTVYTDQRNGNYKQYCTKTIYFEVFFCISNLKYLYDNSTAAGTTIFARY